MATGPSKCRRKSPADFERLTKGDVSETGTFDAREARRRERGSLSLLGLPAAAHAQAGKLPVHVTGGADCGLWLAARQQHGSDILEQYVVGMLDGLSSGADREFWQADGRAVSWDAAYFWIDGYCRAHPTDFLNTATVRLFEERAGVQLSAVVGGSRGQ